MIGMNHRHVLFTFVECLEDTVVQFQLLHKKLFQTFAENMFLLSYLLNLIIPFIKRQVNWNKQLWLSCFFPHHLSSTSANTIIAQEERNHHHHHHHHHHNHHHPPYHPPLVKQHTSNTKVQTINVQQRNKDTNTDNQQKQQTNNIQTINNQQKTNKQTIYKHQLNQ